MCVLSRFSSALLVAAIAAVAPAAFGADPAAAPATSSNVSATTPAAPATGFADRLFLSFSQDAALVPSQWWEAQIEYDDGKNTAPNVFLFRGQVAFRPVKSLEVGGRVGFGNASASGSTPDGSGATDLEAYGKWVFLDAAQNTDFSVGVTLTVPTGDDTAGLGYNSFGSQIFGGVRFRMEQVVLGGHLGVRYNGDGNFQGIPLNGKASFEFAGSALFPLAHQVSLVGELRYETARFDNPTVSSTSADDADTQILAGINWRAFGRGMFRGAVAGGLTDGSPNYRLILGYAYTF
jgi:hypothetical protein